MVVLCAPQLLLKTGTEGRQTVFLFADSQIKDESFMEDISMILNTGDVPNLYPADEKAEIIDKMQTIARNEVRRWHLDIFTDALILTQIMRCKIYIYYVDVVHLFKVRIKAAYQSFTGP